MNTTEAPSRAGAGALSRIDVISDAICPWCWIGKRHLEGALARLADEGERFEVHWRPFQLNPNAVHFVSRIAALKSSRVVGCGTRGRSG